MQDQGEVDDAKSDSAGKGHESNEEAGIGPAPATPQALNQDPRDVSSSAKSKVSDGKIISAETRKKGSVGFGPVITYSKAMGGIGVGATILVLFGGIEGFRLWASLWIADWANDETSDDTGPNKSSSYYIGIYGAICGAQVSVSLGCFLLVAVKSAVAGKTLHNKMFKSLLRAPMSFFNATPLGRIVNRISKDIASIDRDLAQMCVIFLRSLVQIVGTFIIIGLSTPYALASFVPVMTLFFWTYRYFQSTNLELKRLDSVARSPIYQYFSQCLNGADSIRAYKAQNQVAAESARKINNQARFTLALFSANRWLSVRLEVLGSFMIFFAAVFLVAGRHVVDPGTVGLALSYALQITMLLNMTVRLAAVTENGFNAVERVEEYIEVESEKVEAPLNAVKPPADWPPRGHIEFKGVSMQYRANLPLVLKALDFTAFPAQKIGIVGRTGAGKSSTFLTLFRIVEPCAGTIEIDGIDISQLSMKALRSNLAIIPQEPVLFTGTIRFNLDPFGEHDEQVLWDALNRSHLMTFVQKKEGGLDFLVTDNGENFSVGQRQLLCLARALVRRSTILILDEATAAVDVNTDALIQKTIREEFANCTVLAIAHRLNTIIDSDRILVLDAGEKKEFGSPAELLSNPEGYLTSMVNDTGAKNAKLLRDVAFGNVDMRDMIAKQMEDSAEDVSSRLQSISDLGEVHFSAPELETARKALIRVRGAVVESGSASWSAALASQHVTEEQWLSDLRCVLVELLAATDNRLEHFRQSATHADAEAQQVAVTSQFTLH
jgi:ABC-type multidrug transport system fused ATPase/permease subunit